MRCGRTYIDPEHKLAQPVGPGEHQARLIEHLLQRLWQTALKIFSPRFLERQTQVQLRPA